MKICIDPGHGGQDPGATHGARRESNDALRMGLALRDEMTRRRWGVVMTRTTDKTLTLSGRVATAANAGADVYVSLHRNSASDPQGHGVEVLYRTLNTKKSRANDVKSQRLAEAIDSRIVAACGFRDRGAKAQNTNTYVLQHTTMPAVTVEAGFLSNVPTNGQESDSARFDRTFGLLIPSIADGIEYVMGTVSGIVIPTVVPTVTGALPYTFSSPYCRYGEKSERVRWVQTRLNAWGAKLQTDGIFGPKTESAVWAYQWAMSKRGKDTGGIDSIVGPKTAQLLATSAAQAA